MNSSNWRYKKGNRVITSYFEKFNDAEKKYFFTHIPYVFLKLLKNMGFDHKWICVYKFEGIERETVEKMARNNYLIRACIQAGIAYDVINHMRVFR